MSPMTGGKGVCCPSVNAYFVWRGMHLLSETCHKYWTFEWALRKRFSRSEVKDWRHSETRCTFAMEEYIPTVWHRGLLVFV